MAMSEPGIRIIAVGLLSGGLDSTLAARVLLDHGIDVRALNFVSLSGKFFRSIRFVLGTES
ncbi:MAG: hypothetical protein E4H23_03420 [Chrysiogenales bacterium]|nr:hypothetical protein [Candidatus Aminicenantes bacterium]TFG80181.1 MAG: hypothetical protein E4H23_03420 [Chrysiogenales bacterium]